MMQIPKVIHYCWFGENPLPDLTIKCIESWKRFCPGYIIKEWNENNFDLDCCDYIKEAARVGKWAFVSDYARLKILFEEGGLYFDTDVELVASLNDILAQGAFCGLEPPINKAVDSRNLINPGLGMACESGNKVLKEILEVYEQEHYILSDGTFNKKTILNYTSEVFEKYGFNYKNELQVIGGFSIYPVEYFCPMNYSTGVLSLTTNTRGVHHYSMSWKTKYEIALKNWERKCKKNCGDNWGRRFFKITTLPIRCVHKVWILVLKR